MIELAEHVRADDEIYIQMARLFSQKSKCVSHRVGCLLVKDRRIVANGYNGTPSDHPNCDEVFSHRSYDRELHHAFSTRFEIHAEMNAILFATREGISTKGTTLYTTLQPCSACLKNIIQAGIVKIVYSDVYDKSGWDAETVKFLQRSSVMLVHHPVEPNK